MSYAPQTELQYVSWGLQKEESEIVSNGGFQKSSMFFTVPASFSFFFFLGGGGLGVVKIIMVKSCEICLPVLCFLRKNTAVFCIKTLPHLSYYTSKKGKIRRDLHPRFLSIFWNGRYLNCHPQGKKKKIFQHQFTRRPASQHKKKKKYS